MSIARKSPVAGSAALLTVSLALCFGAAEAAAATAAPAWRATDSGERVAISTRQRHALATLFAQLTDAARQFQQAPQVVAMAPPRPTVLEPAHAMPALYRPLDRPHSLPTPPLRAALRNLPPPALR